MRDLSGHEVLDVKEARERGHLELEALRAKVARILDNITLLNRSFVDERLAELAREKRGIERRLEELERLSWQDQELATLIGEVGVFLHQLRWTLENGSPEERVRAVRRCVERVVVSKGRRVEVELRVVPAIIGEEKNRLRVSVPLRSAERVVKRSER